MLRKMPIVLLALIIFIICIDGLLPVPFKSAIYAFSLSVKSLIIFILPFLIFMLLFKTIAQVAKSATKMILVILAAVCCSSFISMMISYWIGSAVYHMDISIALPHDGQGLAPAWSFALPKLIANDHAMFAGILTGILFSFWKPALAARVSGFFDKVVGAILRAISYSLPLFISGFMIKMVHDKTLNMIVGEYSLIFLIVACSQFSYIVFLYLASNGFRIRDALSCIKNMVPAGIAGFSSMSSAAAMPLTIMGTEKNAKNGALARLAIPATVNVHLIGDGFATPIFAFAVMKNFGAAEPAFFTYLIFALYFVIAKFSVAGIPGGGIIVMLPILESQLGFSGEMASLITALYILFDPVITCANVSGNGAFALILEKIQGTFLSFRTAKK